VWECITKKGHARTDSIAFSLSLPPSLPPSRQPSWRRIVSLCVASGIACPAFSASLGYFDSYRRARLPANLTQAQRDFFGGHTYERVDKEGWFHCAWTESHKDIGDANQRRTGEL